VPSGAGAAVKDAEVKFINAQQLVLAATKTN